MADTNNTASITDANPLLLHGLVVPKQTLYANQSTKFETPIGIVTKCEARKFSIFWLKHPDYPEGIQDDATTSKLYHFLGAFPKIFEKIKLNGVQPSSEKILKQSKKKSTSKEPSKKQLRAQKIAETFPVSEDESSDDGSEDNESLDCSEVVQQKSCLPTGLNNAPLATSSNAVISKKQTALIFTSPEVVQQKSCLPTGLNNEPLATSSNAVISKKQTALIFTSPVRKSVPIVKHLPPSNIMTEVDLDDFSIDTFSSEHTNGKLETAINYTNIYFYHFICSYRLSDDKCRRQTI
jgi:hypothetical protein